MVPSKKFFLIHKRGSANFFLEDKRSNILKNVYKLTKTHEFKKIQNPWTLMQIHSIYSYVCTVLATLQRNLLHKPLKVHKNENFVWLRFSILYYSIVSYVKILRFFKKKLFDWAIIGGGTIFPRSLRTTRNEKIF